MRFRYLYLSLCTFSAWKIHQENPTINSLSSPYDFLPIENSCSNCAIQSLAFTCSKNPARFFAHDFVIAFTRFLFGNVLIELIYKSSTAIFPFWKISPSRFFIDNSVIQSLLPCLLGFSLEDFARRSPDSNHFILDTRPYIFPVGTSWR